MLINYLCSQTNWYRVRSPLCSVPFFMHDPACRKIISVFVPLLAVLGKFSLSNGPCRGHLKHDASAGWVFARSCGGRDLLLSALPLTKYEQI